MYPIRSSSPYNYLATLYTNKEFMQYFVKDLYIAFLDRFKASTFLLICNGIFLIQKYKNILGAYQYFHTAQKLGCSFAEQFQIFVAKYAPNNYINQLIIFLGRYWPRRSPSGTPCVITSYRRAPTTRTTSGI